MTSVIIVNYHSAVLTERAVKSLFGDKEDLEVFVVDNGSTQPEKELLGDLSNQYPVSLIFNDENTGFARANNQAFALSRGDHVLLLNPDAFMLTSSLRTLRRFFGSKPDAGAVSPLVYWDDAMSFSFPLYPLPSPLGDLFVRLSGASALFESCYSLHARNKNIRLWTSHLPVKVKNLHGGAVMVKRAAVEKAGGLFDERFFLFYEDTDLFLRLRKRGYGLYILPDAKAVHNYSHGRRKLEIMAKTEHLFYEKHYRGSLLPKFSSLLPARRSRTFTDHGTWRTPPSFLVPGELQRGYLFEWSPTPLFIPSIGCFGRGEVFEMPHQIWDFLDPDLYFSRITDPGKILLRTTTLQWRKEA